jgi:hypothetical protein
MADRDRKTRRATVPEGQGDAPATNHRVRGGGITPEERLDKVLDEIDDLLVENAGELVTSDADPAPLAVARADVPPRGSVAEAVLGPQVL